MAANDYPDVHPEARAAWRSWLAEHHASSRGVWLVSWKKHTGKPAVGYEAAVEEAICFGWVDSLPRKLDADRSKLLFTPRKPASGWSRPNKERVARMERAKQIEPAGRAVIDAARRDGSWSKLDAIENLEVPADLAAAFDANPPAAERWEAFPRSVKRGILEWIAQAKRPATRQKRVRETAERAARNERANQWRKDPLT